VFFQSRKERTQSQRDYEYKNAVERCYRWHTVVLALCSSHKFVGFNVDYDAELSGQSRFDESAFKMYGVVHEHGAHEGHVPCEIEISETEASHDTIGILALTTTTLVARGWLAPWLGKPIDHGKPITEEELDLCLGVRLHITRQLRLCLFDSLRDAALSGYGFMHIQLGCQPPEPTEEDVRMALSKIRECATGPTRTIVNLKMWPQLELQNSPTWARHKD
jgi:hypothetical protein